MSTRFEFSLAELAAHVHGELVGESRPIRGVNGLETAESHELSFYSNARYRSAYDATRAGGVLIELDTPVRSGLPAIRVPQPYLAFARISQLFHPQTRPPTGVAPGAHVAPTAQVHASATVMAGATVEAFARVGARTVLFPGVFVGEGAQVGEDCILRPNVTVAHQCLLGNRVTVHSSTVIGADGFGFAFDAQTPAHVKVPQVGRVRIEDDVELGACCCVDRATFGETVVGRGSKIDNLVQIAHNVHIGPLSIVCAQVGISGSAQVGSGVILAGQVGVVGHIRLGDRVRVGAQSGVAHDLPDDATVSGAPALDHRQWLKVSAAVPRVPEMRRELQSLRRRLNELEERERQR